jgi:hypothetical protein
VAKIAPEALIEQVCDSALGALATMRLTRAVTTDEIGEKYVVAPARKWANGDPKRTFWTDALECPYCVGTWIGYGVLASGLIARQTGPRTHKAWRFVAAGLALNYIVGHVSSRLD